VRLCSRDPQWPKDRRSCQRTVSACTGWRVRTNQAIARSTGSGRRNLRQNFLNPALSNSALFWCVPACKLGL
jgi:hypothetical protein